MDLRKEKNLKKIESIINKTFKKEIDKTIKKVQKEYKSDIFGFGERLYKDNNSYWKKVDKNWNDTFSNMKYNIKTNIIIKNLSSTINAIKEG
jgi:spore germination protein KC